MARREEFVAAHHRAPTERRIRLGAARDGRLRFVDEQVARRGRSDAVDGDQCRRREQRPAAAPRRRRARRDPARADEHAVADPVSRPDGRRGPVLPRAGRRRARARAADRSAAAAAAQPSPRSTCWPACPMQARSSNAATASAPTRSAGPIARRDRSATATGGAASAWARWPTTPRSTNRASPRSHACDGGRFEVRVGITEIGGGADTVFAQIAAEALGVPIERVSTHCGDSATTPRSIDATNHSRTSAVVGPSVRAAATQLKRVLQQSGASTFATQELAALVQCARRVRVPAPSASGRRRGCSPRCSARTSSRWRCMRAAGRCGCFARSARTTPAAC